MKSSATLILLLAVSASASQQFSTPLKRRSRPGARSKNVVARVVSRAASLKSRASGGSTSVLATLADISAYTISVGIGHPAQYYNLVVDTGSANTWCGARTAYNQTSTSISTGNEVSVSYEHGYFIGLEFLDQVAIAPKLVITNQSIGVTNQSFTNLRDFDGRLGLGPVDLTIGTLTSDKNENIPTVLNNLKAQKLIDNQVLGLYFAPDADGTVTFGGFDSSLLKGELTYAPLTTTQPASNYWGVDITSATCGNHTIISDSAAGIVDTGSLLTGLSGDIFERYLNVTPGATTIGPMIEIPEASIQDIQPLHFTFGNRVFTLDPAAQVFSKETSAALGATPGTRLSTIFQLNSTGGLDFSLGLTFLERFYTVLDADNQRVGLAETKNTFSTFEL